ncbi:hypothetical protein [Merismopedia glauca]|uniref:Uncharacterized protein n=1 Tax=Merismopedia glauca CCAP 1448/3 TaxID=1296344 RepID=A0A2T1C7M9_9CYAN|nr:hypothetical protein [Merismopedia glauca]PSB04246.1 hypothetical protein C7B64_04605 [Merismopedia glauca CCAP 1448/3]
MPKILILLLGLLLSLGLAFPAQASTCKNYNNHKICILNIKRSAKYAWEYRVVVSVDDMKRPLEVYDCRDRVRVQPDGHIIPFSQDEAGNLICSFFRN